MINGKEKQMAEPLLQIVDLQTHFFTPEGTVRAVDGVTYNVFPGETLGLVGESGSGKSVSALSLMRLIPNPPGKIVGGDVTFAGEEILKVDEDRMREIRGKRYRHGLPGAHDVSQPGAHDQYPGHGSTGAASQDESPSGSRAGGGVAVHGGNSCRGGAARRLPASVLGRDAAARDDCDGARLRSEVALGGRAHHPHWT